MKKVLISIKYLKYMFFNFFIRQLQDLQNMKKIVVKNEDDINDVSILPEEVEPATLNSNISFRLDQQRKKKYK